MPSARSTAVVELDLKGTKMKASLHTFAGTHTRAVAVRSVEVDVSMRGERGEHQIRVVAAMSLIGRSAAPEKSSLERLVALLNEKCLAQKVKGSFRNRTRNWTAADGQRFNQCERLLLGRRRSGQRAVQEGPERKVLKQTDGVGRSDSKSRAWRPSKGKGQGQGRRVKGRRSSRQSTGGGKNVTTTRMTGPRSQSSAVSIQAVRSTVGTVVTTQASSGTLATQLGEVESMQQLSREFRSMFAESAGIIGRLAEAVTANNKKQDEAAGRNKEVLSRLEALERKFAKRDDDSDV